MDGSFLANLTNQINALSNLIYQPYAIPAILVIVGGWLTVRDGLCTDSTVPSSSAIREAKRVQT